MKIKQLLLKIASRMSHIATSTAGLEPYDGTAHIYSSSKRGEWARKPCIAAIFTSQRRSLYSPVSMHFLSGTYAKIQLAAYSTTVTIGACTCTCWFSAVQICINMGTAVFIFTVPQALSARKIVGVTPVLGVQYCWEAWSTLTSSRDSQKQMIASASPMTPPKRFVLKAKAYESLPTCFSTSQQINRESCHGISIAGAHVCTHISHTISRQPSAICLRW